MLTKIGDTTKAHPKQRVAFVERKNFGAVRAAFGHGLATARDIAAIDEIKSLTGRLNFNFKNDVVVDRTVLQKCYGFEMNRYLDVILTFSQSIAYGEKLV